MPGLARVLDVCLWGDAVGVVVSSTTTATSDGADKEAVRLLPACEECWEDLRAIPAPSGGVEGGGIGGMPNGVVEGEGEGEGKDEALAYSPGVERLRMYDFRV